MKLCLNSLPSSSWERRIRRDSSDNPAIASSERVRPSTSASDSRPSDQSDDIALPPAMPDPDRIGLQSLRALGVKRDNFCPEAYCAEDFEQYRTIGVGSFARVRLAKLKKDGVFCALKIFSRRHQVKMNQVEHSNNEARIQYSCQHPFIAQSYGSFHDKDDLYVAMEYVEGGELFGLLQQANVCPRTTL